MKIKCVEHADYFGLNEVICWAEVVGVPDEYVEKAKLLDGENYHEGCFGICVGKDDDGWYICEGEPGCYLFYIDNDGDKHWMNYKLTAVSGFEAIKFCRKYIDGEEK